MQVKHNDELRICNWQHKTSSRRSLAEASRSCARWHLVLPHTTAPAHEVLRQQGPIKRPRLDPAHRRREANARPTLHTSQSSPLPTAVATPPEALPLSWRRRAQQCWSPNSQIEGRELSEIFPVVSWKKEKTKEKHQHFHRFSHTSPSCRRLAMSGRGRSGTDEPGVRGCSLSAWISPQRLAPSWSAFPSQGISLSLADTSDCDHSTGYL